MAIPVFIISLDDASERRAPLLAMLKKYDVRYEIVSAVDGRIGLPEKFEHDVDRPGAIAEWGRELTSAEYACALSHQIIYKKMVTEKINGAVVLEDDAIVGQKFADFTKQPCPRWADLVMFNHFRSLVWQFPWRRILKDVNVYRHARKSPSWTSGYYLNLRAAKYIRECSRPLRRPADWPCEIYNLRSFSTLPRIVTCDEDRSGVMASYIKVDRVKLRKQHSDASMVLKNRKIAEEHENTSHLVRFFLKHLTRQIS